MVNGDFQDPGQGLRQQGLAGAGFAQEEHIALGQLHLLGTPVRLAAEPDALVVVVHRDGQLLLGLFLPDHVLVEPGLDLLGGSAGASGAAARSGPSPRGLALLAMMSLQIATHSSQMKIRSGPAIRTTSPCSLLQNEQVSVSEGPPLRLFPFAGTQVTPGKSGSSRLVGAARRAGPTKPRDAEATILPPWRQGHCSPGARFRSAVRGRLLNPAARSPRPRSRIRAPVRRS